jgi:probable lipoprotein (TIGR04455 family)
MRRAERRHVFGLLCGLGLQLSLGAGCSSLRSAWAEPDYQARPLPGASPRVAPIKRIRVVGWEDGRCPGLGDVLAAVVGDLVKLRKNYLVLGNQTARIQWAEACGANVSGVLFVRPLQCARSSLSVELRLSMELYACADGSLLWRAEGAQAHRSSDASLTDLVTHYTADLGPRAAAYGAPVFAVSQDLVDALPDPQLTDAEIVEKIELP